MKLCLMRMADDVKEIRVLDVDGNPVNGFAVDMVVPDGMAPPDFAVFYAEAAFEALASKDMGTA